MNFEFWFSGIAVSLLIAAVGLLLHGWNKLQDAKMTVRLLEDSLKEVEEDRDYFEKQCFRMNSELIAAKAAYNAIKAVRK